MSGVCATCAASVPAVARATRRRWDLLVRRASWRSWLEGIEAAEAPFEYNYSYDPLPFPVSVRGALLTNHCDEGTAAFLQRCAERHRSVCAMLVDQFSLILLRPFFSTTTVNALAFRGRMHVLSTAQFRAHLQLDEGERVQRILDIGAGDGNVTAQLAPLCHSQVDVTETNPVMCMRLQMRGYTVYGRDNWQKNGPVYDVVSCLNVLDRCEDPVALMQTMLRSLTPGGKLLIALALPYNPWIDEGKRGRRPARPLAVRGRTFTEAAASFVRDVAAPLGLNVLSLSKAPYLCEGDSYRPYYVLDDMLVVLQPQQPA